MWLLARSRRSKEVEILVEAALALLGREREPVRQWAQTEDSDAVEDAWALSNGREAIREEPW